MNKHMTKPIIAVPIGDPAGIGPEIVAKAFADEKTQKTARCLAIGDTAVMEQAIRITGVPLRIQKVQNPEDGRYEQGILNLLPIDNIDMNRFTFGKVNGMCGKAAFKYIEKSIDLAVQKSGRSCHNTDKQRGFKSRRSKFYRTHRNFRCAYGNGRPLDHV